MRLSIDKIGREDSRETEVPGHWEPWEDPEEEIQAGEPTLATL